MMTVEKFKEVLLEKITDEVIEEALVLDIEDDIDINLLPGSKFDLLIFIYPNESGSLGVILSYDEGQVMFTHKGEMNAESVVNALIDTLANTTVMTDNGNTMRPICSFTQCIDMIEYGVDPYSEQEFIKGAEIRLLKISEGSPYVLKYNGKTACVPYKELTNVPGDLDVYQEYLKDITALDTTLFIMNIARKWKQMIGADM